MTTGRPVTHAIPMYAERLKALRKNRSQAQIADAVGLSLSAYQKYETGERRPSYDTMRKLADYYKRSVTFIFFAD